MNKTKITRQCNLLWNEQPLPYVNRNYKVVKQHEQSKKFIQIAYFNLPNAHILPDEGFTPWPSLLFVFQTRSLRAWRGCYTLWSCIDYAWVRLIQVLEGTRIPGVSCLSYDVTVIGANQMDTFYICHSFYSLR